ncbi:helix-turn-helix domain-containing protein [Paenibacillus sepulcri]|uniref:helix-turn-helix domain-containing protein n=1 Tax=Paenibacillus sepulcri TaxID=359917 RepID=UPI001AEADB0B
MYSVMLVDDDFPVLEFLSGMIPWQELELKLHSACKNGAAALEKARAQPPDIVVTDIGMPQMDGIQLIAELKQLKPDIRVVILSCMDDFSYAQKAVRLQVDDYVLKETMNQQQMIELLTRIRSELADRSRISAQIDSFKSIAEENEMAQKQTLLHKMLHGTETAVPAWIREAELLGIALEGKSYLPIMCYLNPDAQVRERLIQDSPMMLALMTAVTEVMQAQPGVLLLPNNVREYIILIPYRRTLKENAYEAFRPLIQELHLQLKRQFGMVATFIYGNAAGDPLELSAEISWLLGGSAYRFYLAEGGIYPRSAFTEFAGGDLYEHYPDALGEIRDAFLEEEEDRLGGIIIRWMALIRSRRYPPEIVKEWTLKILYDIQSRLLALQHYQTTFSLEVLHQTIADISTLDELAAWVQKFFRERIPLVQLIYSQSRRSEILEAQQYVTKHINKKITLEEVADILHINSSYFSRLFKKETGHNFINYVTFAKMERAKELLDKTGISVEKIAEKLGYDNKSYFTKLFKKHTGSTPGEYRGA